MPQSADFAATDFFARVAGGLGFEIIGLAMDNHRAAYDLLYGKSGSKHSQKGVAPVSKEGRQVAGVGWVGAASGIIVEARVGKGVLGGSGAAPALVNVKGEDWGGAAGVRAGQAPEFRYKQNPVTVLIEIDGAGEGGMLRTASNLCPGSGRSSRELGKPAGRKQ